MNLSKKNEGISLHFAATVGHSVCPVLARSSRGGAARPPRSIAFNLTQSQLRATVGQLDCARVTHQRLSRDFGAMRWGAAVVVMAMHKVIMFLKHSMVHQLIATGGDATAMCHVGYSLWTIQKARLLRAVWRF